MELDLKNAMRTLVVEVSSLLDVVDVWRDCCHSAVKTRGILTSSGT